MLHVDACAIETVCNLGSKLRRQPNYLRIVSTVIDVLLLSQDAKTMMLDTRVNNMQHHINPKREQQTPHTLKNPHTPRKLVQHEAL